LFAVAGQPQRVNVPKKLPSLRAVLDFCYLDKVDPDNENLSDLVQLFI
jgi:hypothetical protein